MTKYFHNKYSFPKTKKVPLKNKYALNSKGSFKSIDKAQIKLNKRPKERKIAMLLNILLKNLSIVSKKELHPSLPTLKNSNKS